MPTTPDRTSRPLLREVAATGDGRDITRAYSAPLDLLAPQDSVLQSRGGD